MNYSKFLRNKKITKSYQIKKELIKHTILFDPLVDENFYCRQLDYLNITDSEIESLYNNIGKDIPSLMALLRGRQIGIISKEFIYDAILQPTDAKWLIDPVKIKIYKLLGLDEIKRMCYNNIDLYEIAVKRRFNGESFDDVCSFVQYSLIKSNKE